VLEPEQHQRDDRYSADFIENKKSGCNYEWPANSHTNPLSELQDSLHKAQLQRLLGFQIPVLGRPLYHFLRIK
jgi:hypothetical protein